MKFLTYSDLFHFSRIGNFINLGTMIFDYSCSYSSFFSLIYVFVVKPSCWWFYWPPEKNEYFEMPKVGIVKSSAPPSGIFFYFLFTLNSVQIIRNKLHMRITCLFRAVTRLVLSVFICCLIDALAATNWQWWWLGQVLFVFLSPVFWHLGSFTLGKMSREAVVQHIFTLKCPFVVWILSHKLYYSKKKMIGIK